MLHFLPLGEWKKRADLVRASVSELAESAGVDPSNVFRKLRNGTDMRGQSLVKLTEALVRREREIFDRLVALHPEWLTDSRAARSPSSSLPRKREDGGAQLEAAE